MDDSEAMGRLLDALRPWRGQLVIVGGWAHQLHRLHPLATSVSYDPLLTRDVDVALSPNPQMKGDIGAALTGADFHAELSGEFTPPVSHYHLGPTDGGFYAEFLVPLSGSGLKRNGDPDATLKTAGVTAQKLRHLDILLEQPWSIPLTATTRPPVTRAGRVLIANPVSFIVQKILIQKDRTPEKQSQDTLYIHDTIELFSGSLDSLRALWEKTLSQTLHRNTIKKLATLRTEQYGAVTDVIRTAARMPHGRSLTPDSVQAVCEYGLNEVLGTI